MITLEPPASPHQRTMRGHPAPPSRGASPRGLVTLWAAAALTACAPATPGRPETIAPAPTTSPSPILSPSPSATQATPTSAPTSEPSPTTTHAPETVILLDCVYAVSAAVAWGVAGLASSTGEYWATVVVRSDDGGATWRDVSPVMSPPEAEEVHAAFFLDGQHGWVVTGPGPGDSGVSASASVWRTQDGGQTWSQALLSVDAPALSWDLVFIDPQTGWLLAASDIAMGSQSAAVLRTLNGGADWEVIAAASIADWPPQPGKLSGGCYKTHVWFRDASTGWVMGECLGSGSLIQISLDGGLTWEFQDLPPPAEDPAVFAGAQCQPLNPAFSTPEEGVLPVVCMLDTLIVLRTSDGGRSWEPHSYRRERQIGAVEFVDAAHGWLTYFDETGALLLSATSDAGQSWREIDAGLDGARPSQIDFVDAQAGWALGYASSQAQASVCTSADGGWHWSCAFPRPQTAGPR